MAEAYQRLVDDYSLTQEEVATAVGKDRATVSNYMRLMSLPQEVQGDVAGGVLAMGHARALLGLEDRKAQLRAAREVVTRGLSVRETESLVKQLGRPPMSRETGEKAPEPVDVHTQDAQDRLRVSLGTRVKIVRRGKRGRIEIEFGSENELQRLFEQLTAS